MDSIYKYITQLANSQRRFIDSLAVGKEYSGAQGKVIHYLFTHKDSAVHQKDIEKDFGMRAPTATELLKTLVKKELIQKVPSKKDARLKEIALTGHAEKYREDIFRDIEMLESRLTENISQDELDIWIKVTHQMMENLSGDGK